MENAGLLAVVPVGDEIGNEDAPKDFLKRETCMFLAHVAFISYLLLSGIQCSHKQDHQASHFSLAWINQRGFLIQYVRHALLDVLSGIAYTFQ
jgi:hypothetical protein